MRCSKDGCDWEGEFGDLERHLANKCLYVKEVCPHGCGQLYPRHLLQTHQLDECPQRPLQLQLESVERQLTQKYELLQQQLLEHLEQQEKKHEELQQQLVIQEQKYKEVQQQLIHQEKKHDQDKEELQQQLAQQEKELIQQLTGTNNALTSQCCTQWVVLDHMVCLPKFLTFH